MTEYKKLKNMPYAQAQVRENENYIVLVSYQTDVIIFDKQMSEIVCTGTYSPTTRKHIGAFLKEYFPQLSYQDMKQLHAKSEIYNTLTKEVYPQEEFLLTVTDINGNRFSRVYKSYSTAKEIAICMVNDLRFELDEMNIVSTATGEVLLMQQTYYGELYEAECGDE